MSTPSSRAGVLARTVERARRRFYNIGGPYLRCRLFEAFGSERYSWPGLHGLDRRLAELLPSRGGTFVEAGAHDGYTQSNTYYLERHRSWAGVLVEPVPELRRRCERRRSRSRVVGCALVGPRHGAQTVQMRFGDLMSVVGDDEQHARQGLSTAGREGYAFEAPACTLAAVLDDAGVEDVDLLVLDVEGHELPVLEGLDLDRHAPAYVLVEALDLDSERPAIDDALGPRYELVEALTHCDLLYRRRS